jgi:hypothetical protein
MKHAIVPIFAALFAVASRPGAAVDAVVADRVFFRPEHAEQHLAGGGAGAAA